MMAAVDGRLVVRWAMLARVDPISWMLGVYSGVALAALGAIDDVRLRIFVAGVAVLALAHVLRGFRSRHVLDADGWRQVGRYRSTTVEWASVAEVRWHLDVGMHRTGGWQATLLIGDGTRRWMRPVAQYRRNEVDAWLREHQPDIRIDPKPPWRDRFGAWHVAEPGYDPVETMTSVRRSLVGPWEIMARSCDGGFVAEQRVVRTGVIVTREPVRETLADAKADGVRLVREAVEAAASAHE